MKNNLMSLFVYLSLGFWCFYGSAFLNVNGDIRKYCTVFVSKKLNLEVADIVVTVLDQHPVDGHYTCIFLDDTNKKEYRILINKHAAYSVSDREKKAQEAQSKHSQSDVIEVGGVSFFSPLFAEEQAVYFSIFEIKITSTASVPLGEGVYQLK